MISNIMISRLLRTLVAALACLGGLLVLVTVAPPRWFASLLAGPWPEPKGAVLIVLGADVNDDGSLGETSYRRSLLAVRTWKSSAFRQMVLSGELRSTKPMLDFIVCQGVPTDRILIEDRSTSTRENALFTARFVQKIPGPYVLLTSDYHMFRAHRAFSKAGLAVTPAPFSDVLKTFNDPLRRWTGFLTLAGESAKIGYYWTRGWI
jgi:uncharacterized SAM-binding protein YcdF (DUF218 family)